MNLRKSSPTVNYHVDGCGRDTFIGSNNGGFHKDESTDPKNFFKQLRTQPKESSYIELSKQATPLRSTIAPLKPRHKMSKSNVNVGSMLSRLTQTKSNGNLNMMGLHKKYSSIDQNMPNESQCENLQKQETDNLQKQESDNLKKHVPEPNFGILNQ